MSQGASVEVELTPQEREEFDRAECLTIERDGLQIFVYKRHPKEPDGEPPSTLIH